MPSVWRRRLQGTGRDWCELVASSRPWQDGLTGSAWGDWANYTASPLRAFENELGAQAPLGFWDPLGFTSDGDLYSFKRRRSVELKHGRICMLATMGVLAVAIRKAFEVCVELLKLLYLL